MEMSDLWGYAEKNAEAFAASETFADFAAALDGSKTGTGKYLQHIAARYPGTWDYAYRTLKIHGFMSRELLLPDARKASDIFESVALYPMDGGGKERGQSSHCRAQSAFLSANRAPGFAYFGHVGAKYDLTDTGNKRIARPNQYLTAATPTKEVIAVYGRPCSSDEWGLATFEAIRRDDGKTLIIVRAHNGFASYWLCLLDAGESALDMLSDEEKALIQVETAAKVAAWGVES